MKKCSLEWLHLKSSKLDYNFAAISGEVVGGTQAV